MPLAYDKIQMTKILLLGKMSNALYSLRYSTLDNREIFSYAKTLYHFSVNRLDFLNVTQVKQIYKCSSYKMTLLGTLSQIHMNDSGKVIQ